MLRDVGATHAGNSIFFAVKRIEDPIGLLPAKLILGINKVRSLSARRMAWQDAWTRLSLLHWCVSPRQCVTTLAGFIRKATSFARWQYLCSCAQDWHAPNCALLCAAEPMLSGVHF